MSFMRIEIQNLVTNEIIDAYVGCWNTGVDLVNELCTNELLKHYFILSTSEVNSHPGPNRPEGEMVKAMQILNEVHAYMDNRKGN